MSLFDNFHFIRPAWLLLMPVAVWVWWLIRKSNDPLRNWRAVIEPELLRAMAFGADENVDWRSYGLLVAWVLAVVAVAGPTWRPEPSPFADDPVPVMLLLKANETMDLSDLTPSRMERARLKVADFATERKGRPMGLIAYAGTSHLVLPPTRDTSVVATMAADISPQIMPKAGDNLAKALEQAAATLGEAGGSIVVVADSVADNRGRLAEFRAGSPLPIHFLAVARADTPEQDAISTAATELKATVTMITPDGKDITDIVRQTANVSVAVSAVGEGIRWAESGWWLVPVIAAFVLVAFRREEQPSSEVAR